MHIIWHGQACFQILTNPAKGEQVRIVIDPFSSEIGLRLPKMEADILLVSSDSFLPAAKFVGNKPFLITEPGEYEIKKIFIQGIPSNHTTIYTIEAEGILLCHLGDIKQKELTNGQVERIGDVDILMIPVGGTSTISGIEAAKIISQVEPRIVIPMYYQIPKLKIKLEEIDKFLKVMGEKTIEPQNKLVIKRKDLPSQGMKIVVLKP